MTDEDILEAMSINANWYRKAKDELYDAYRKVDQDLHEEYKKNARHQHFKTRKEARIAMSADFNPYNTFSYGKKDWSNEKKC